MPDTDDRHGAHSARSAPQVEWWLSLASNVVAPVTAISALLFYFGYVSARAEYSYFGVDVDSIGFSTQDFIMRSPASLLVPVLLMAVVAAVVAGVFALARGRRGRSRAAVFGWAVLAAGLVLVLTYAWVGQWPYYPFVTPLVLAVGAALTAYGMGVRNNAPRTTRVAMWVLVAVSAFWANATLAQWTGTGRAMEQARNFALLPAVVLDTKERLFLADSDRHEERLPVEEGQTFRYRYTGLRLLIQSSDRMFLVPDQWSPDSSTLLVRVDDSVRVKFRFVDQPP